MCWLGRILRLSCRQHEFIDAHSSHVSAYISIIHCASFFVKTTFYLLANFGIAANLPGNHHHNDSSSCSSGPESPNGQGDNSGRTQYVSATCVVVTHYSGDVANVVDEHFTRALNFNDKSGKGKPCIFILLWEFITKIRFLIDLKAARDVAH